MNMSRIRWRKARLFAPCSRPRPSYSRVMACFHPSFISGLLRRRGASWAGLAVGWLALTSQAGASPPAAAASGITSEHLVAVAAFARSSAERAAADLGGVQRLEVEVGAADPRLRLAACRRAEARAVTGAPALGRTRVGLQCLDGETRWSVTLPVTIRAWGSAWVAARPVPAGSTLSAADLQRAVVDLAAERSAAWTDAAPPDGRELQRALGAGEAVRQSHLRTRQWFAAGETVRVLARGPGFTVVGSGQAMGPGLDGQSIRVRTEGGRILSGVATGERSVEVAL